MENKEEIVNQFAKYCAQCDGLCCKRGVFSVFGWEAKKLAREHKEFQNADVFDQRGAAKDIFICGKCIFYENNGCKLPVESRPIDCLSFPFYPILKEINGELKIDSFGIQDECPYSKEITNNKRFLEDVQILWAGIVKKITTEEIVDWIGAEGSWRMWYENAVEVEKKR